MCFPAVVWGRGTFTFHHSGSSGPKHGVCTVYPPLPMRSQGLPAFLTLKAQLSLDSFLLRRDAVDAVACGHHDFPALGFASLVPSARSGCFLSQASSSWASRCCNCLQY